MKPAPRTQPNKNVEDLEPERLNPAQKRSLGVALRLLEERLDEIEPLLAGGTGGGILAVVENDLNPEQIADVRRVFAQIRKTIAVARQTFNLPVEREKLSNLLKGTVSYFGSILADKTAQKMIRYGAVSPDLSRDLDPIIETFDQLLNRVRKSVHTPNE